MDFPIAITVLLFLVAIAYAAVGHGGASGYLAIMGIFSFPSTQIKVIALCLNLLVAAISFFHFYRKGYFRMALFLPFAVASIPMAYIGGLINLDAAIYKKILAAVLFFAIIRMLFIQYKESTSNSKISLPLALLIGGIIGFLSGLIGIGGGIILSPVILMLNWGNLKETAAVSALFIWVNSAAGLTGQLNTGHSIPEVTWFFGISVVIAAIIGGYLGSHLLSNNKLKYVLAVVLLTACVKLLFL